MPADSILLTIAIPTFERAVLLDQALSILLPLVRRHPDVEVLISDNCSPDETPQVISKHLHSPHPNVRYQRHPENIGPDANFISCYNNARGRYFWICSDDDLILEGAFDRLLGQLRSENYDLVFAGSYSFRSDYLAEYRPDALGRRFHVIESARDFAFIGNIMFTFISGMIVNKERLERLPHEPLTEFVGTYLVQLSWVLPLLVSHRRSLVFWERLVAARGGNAGGYSFGEVWGERLSSLTSRLLPGCPNVAQVIVNVALRGWFPAAIYDLRREGNRRCNLEDAPRLLRRYYGRNFRFWLFVYPVFRLPLQLAHLWVRCGNVLNKVIFMLRFPMFWRKEILASERPASWQTVENR